MNLLTKALIFYRVDIVPALSMLVYIKIMSQFHTYI